MKKITTTLLMAGLAGMIHAQCPVGQSEVTVDVATDDYGYEVYWELLPSGNNCGTGTIFAGGNTAVGCNGGGAEDQTPGGYGNNTVINEGPWCLDDGVSYDIIYTDDWADGGAMFTVNIAGFPIYIFDGGTGDDPGDVYPFIVNPPQPWDNEAQAITCHNYLNTGLVDISGKLRNVGANTITSLDINYQIDNGVTVTSNLTGLSIAPFTTYNFTHPVQWNASSNGTYNIKIWASALDGNADMNTINDTIDKDVLVGPGTPNLIDGYIGIIPQQTVIASGGDFIITPRDLDFHPTLTEYELWVVLKSTEGSGGQTVKITNAGQVGQTSLLQQDGNAWHFMSLPTGIAFSPNENFATSPGVYDANHDGGSPFTGPALWSSDPIIYAQPSGGNGSHLDMLHESHYVMGIAHEVDNAFWVFDGDCDCPVRYDFKEDHGPGNSYHGDGTIRKYYDLDLEEEPTRHVASHMVLDKATNWLYIVDTGNDQIVRLDITSGSATSTFTPYETVAEASIFSGATWEVYVSTGLEEPSGIDIIGNRMIVSDHATGEIIIYDISGPAALELGRIETGQPGIMGVKIGPDGKIWYVNATSDEVVRLEFVDLTGVTEQQLQISFTIYPNPATDQVSFKTPTPGEVLRVTDLSGRVVFSQQITANDTQLDLSELPGGVYIVHYNGGTEKLTRL